MPVCCLQRALEVLDGNAIGEAGGTALAAAIPSMPSLAGLYVINTNLGEGGRRALDEAVQATGRAIEVEYD